MSYQDFWPSIYFDAFRPFSTVFDNFGHSLGAGHDLQGFLTAIKARWADRTEVDETTGILRVVGKIPRCGCPLVKISRTPADFCTCTTGWNQFAFSIVTGKPVTVELEESVLRGSPRCTHRIIEIKG